TCDECAVPSPKFQSKEGWVVQPVAVAVDKNWTATPLFPVAGTVAPQFSAHAWNGVNAAALAFAGASGPRELSCERLEFEVWVELMEFSAFSRRAASPDRSKSVDTTVAPRMKVRERRSVMVRELDVFVGNTAFKRRRIRPLRTDIG